jgi:hypothetical protein
MPKAQITGEVGAARRRNVERWKVEGCKVWEKKVKRGRPKGRRYGEGIVPLREWGGKKDGDIKSPLRGGRGNCTGLKTRQYALEVSLNVQTFLFETGKFGGHGKFPLRGER